MKRALLLFCFLFVYLASSELVVETIAGRTNTVDINYEFANKTRFGDNKENGISITPNNEVIFEVDFGVFLKYNPSNDKVAHYIGSGIPERPKVGFGPNVTIVSNLNHWAIASNGEAYFGDGFVIYKVDLQGMVSLWAGNASSADTTVYENQDRLSVKLNQVRDLLIVGTHMYILENSRHRIRRFDLETGLISTIAGQTTSGISNNANGLNALFYNPNKLAYDPVGNRLLVTHSQTNNQGLVVRSVALTGQYAVTSLHSTASPTFSIYRTRFADSTLWLGSNTGLYKIHTGAPTVLTKFISYTASAACSAVDGPFATATFHTRFVNFDITSSGDIYHYGGDCLRKYNIYNNITKTLIGKCCPDPVPMEGVAIEIPVYASLLAYDNNQNLYATDALTIRKITPSGDMTLLVNTTTIRGFDYQRSTDTIFMINTLYIQKVSPVGKITTLHGPWDIEGIPRWGNLRNIAVAADNSFYLYDETELAFFHLSASGDVCTKLAGYGVSGEDPIDGLVGTATVHVFYHMAIFRGEIYFSDFNSIRKYTPSTRNFTTLVKGNGFGQFVFDSQNTMLVTAYTREIYRYNLHTKEVTKIISTPAAYPFDFDGPLVCTAINQVLSLAKNPVTGEIAFGDVSKKIRLIKNVEVYSGPKINCPFDPVVNLTANASAVIYELIPTTTASLMAGDTGDNYHNPPVSPSSSTGTGSTIPTAPDTNCRPFAQLEAIGAYCVDGRWYIPGNFTIQNLFSRTDIIVGENLFVSNWTIIDVPGQPIIVKGCVYMSGGVTIIIPEDSTLQETKDVTLLEYNCSSGAFSSVSIKDENPCIEVESEPKSGQGRYGVLLKVDRDAESEGCQQGESAKEEDDISDAVGIDFPYLVLIFIGAFVLFGAGLIAFLLARRKRKNNGSQQAIEN